MDAIKNFKKATSLASKPNTFLVLLHKLNGSIEFKTFEEDFTQRDFIYEMLPPQKKQRKLKKGEEPLPPAERMKLPYPKMNEVERANASKTRVIHYNEYKNKDGEFIYKSFNFTDSKFLVGQVQENNSVQLQNHISIYLMLDELKRGDSTLGFILSNPNTIKIVFVIGIGLVFVLTNMN